MFLLLCCIVDICATYRNPSLDQPLSKNRSHWWAHKVGWTAKRFIYRPQGKNLHTRGRRRSGRTQDTFNASKFAFKSSLFLFLLQYLLSDNGWLQRRIDNWKSGLFWNVRFHICHLNWKWWRKRPNSVKRFCRHNWFRKLHIASILFPKSQKSTETIEQFNIKFTFRRFGETCGCRFGYSFVVFTFILDSHLHHQDKVSLGKVAAGQSDKKGRASQGWRVVLLQSSGEDSRRSRNPFPLL